MCISKSQLNLELRHFKATYPARYWNVNAISAATSSSSTVRYPYPTISVAGCDCVSANANAFTTGRFQPNAAAGVRSLHAVSSPTAARHDTSGFRLEFSPQFIQQNYQTYWAFF
ncbi:hypothetical protein MKW94_015172 [Papaver nudicaule]|uniref:Uncharacterized protein n=1 Tax=Papaver nudicaule TaxID=74823 RepID=A0AA41VTK2_PAPNU|nr:hypothetical protein [Papaver nudicaule]